MPGSTQALRWQQLRLSADLSSLETDWRELGQHHGSALDQFDWVQSCAEQLTDSDQLEIITAHAGDQLVAAAPLATSRIRGVQRRVLLGEAELGEPSNVLAANAAVAAELATRLVDQGVPLVWQRVLADSPIVAALTHPAARRAIVHQRPAPPAPYLPLDSTWTTPESHLGSGRRSDYRRARRRAEEQGTLQTDILTPTLAELGPLLREALAVEGRSWKGDLGTALVCDARRAAFFERLTQSACRQGTLRLAMLRLNSVAIAMQLALVHGGRYWILKVGYDPAYAKCSPGVLLMRDSIAWAAAQGLTGFEFLGRSEPWIDQWTDQRHACVSLRVYPRSLAGLAALSVDGVARAAESLQRGASDATTTVRRAIGRGLRWVASRAARSYISGNTLSDAERVRRQLAPRGLTATIGFWDGEHDTPRAIADEYRRGIELLAADTTGGYLSIKLPALGATETLLLEVADRAAAAHVRLHFDSLGIEQADRNRRAIEMLREGHPGLPLSLTLPGRWARSVEDARWAAEHGVGVRVVKGQWADPAEPDRDPRVGCLAIVEQLAACRFPQTTTRTPEPANSIAVATMTTQRAGPVHVSVATHDLSLLGPAIERLRASGTPCDIELLYGLPMRAALRQARALHATVRVYIPYGAAYLPYAAGKLRSNPRVAWWLLKDASAACVRATAQGALPFVTAE